MAERRQAGVRALSQHGVPPADATASVDVEQVPAAGVAEAGAKRQHAQRTLQTKTREPESGRKAHMQRQLEAEKPRERRTT
jgi:hypothetical protein